MRTSLRDYWSQIAGRRAAARRVAAPPPGDLDLRHIGAALWRRRAWIVVPTLLTLVASFVTVNMMTPKYRSEARILLDGRENVFLQPTGGRGEDRIAADPEAVPSQVQLLLSRELAREVIARNKLAELAEFDPVLKGVSPLRSVLALIGLTRDPLKMTPDERVMESYYARLTAYAVDKSRVMVVEFTSSDPELAARVANSVVEGYLVLQQAARQDQAKAASQWLAGEIDKLRDKVAAAERRAEDFRSKSSLFVGTNNTSLSNQQLSELTTQLNAASAQKSDAEAKSKLIREMVQRGQPIESSEILNSELIRRLSEQRVTLRAQLAEQSTTLLGNHPRIKELRAQIGDLDRQLRDEALKISRSLENDARIAGARLDALSANLDRFKRQAASTNTEDVQLRALEREARAERELLESYLAKYREATTRENMEAAPVESRIISRAVVTNTPASPKKLPVVLISTLAMLMLTSGIVVTSELLRITAPAHAVAPGGTRAEPVLPPQAAVAPVAPPAAPVVPVVDELEQVAAELRRAGEGGRKVTMLGGGDVAAVTEAALALARLLSRDAKVVLVDLSGAAELAEASEEPAAPGLTDLMRGEASFGEIVTRDRASRLHLVSAGHGARADRTALASPRLTLAFDALLRVYDHVVLDAGGATDLPATLLAGEARAVVVPTPAMDAVARREMGEQLLAIGFTAVTMLDGDSAAPAEARASAAA
ncbi:MAG: exopolysaccharide transport family protein [Xanthobacteraceae bacterium]